RDATAEHLAMIMSVHGLKEDLPGNHELAHDRIRGATMAAEGVLHDLGVIPITSSDAQGMGRAGETFARTFALAGAMKAQRGPLPDDGERHDNARALRYLSKLTLNPAIAHGMAAEIGSLAVGRLADIVLWDPAYFGVKPNLVLKAGIPAWGLTGDPNATIDASQPLVYGPQFGGHGAAAAELSLLFVSRACLDSGEDALPTARRRVAVTGCRSAHLTTMAHNGRTGTVEVDPHTAVVRFDGAVVAANPLDRVALSRLYLL
ncbi:MAG: amidohydrolase family protein, partial [Nostocoides sp.]